MKHIENQLADETSAGLYHTTTAVNSRGETARCRTKYHTAQYLVRIFPFFYFGRHNLLTPGMYISTCMHDDDFCLRCTFVISGVLYGSCVHSHPFNVTTAVRNNRFTVGIDCCVLDSCSNPTPRPLRHHHRHGYRHRHECKRFTPQTYISR